MNPENDSTDAAYEAHMEEQAAEPYYTPTQAARVLNRSDRWVRKELAEGRMEGEQDLNGRWHIPARVVDEWRDAADKEHGRAAHAAVETVYRNIGPQRGSAEVVGRILEMLAETSARAERLQYELGRAQARAEMLQAELDAERSKG